MIFIKMFTSNIYIWLVIYRFPLSNFKYRPLMRSLLSQFQTPTTPRRAVGFFGSGSLPGHPSEPITQLGVPEAALLVEPESRDTVENAREVARLLRPRGGRFVLLVSDRVHLPRAALLFRLAGLRIAGWAGVPPPSFWWEARTTVQECTALPRSLVRTLLRPARTGHWSGTWTQTTRSRRRAAISASS